MAGSFYTPLPQYEVPRNAMLDFTPINKGVDAIASGVTAARNEERNLMVTKALASGDYAGAMGATNDPNLALHIGTAQRQQAAEGRAQKQFDADWFGQQAMAINNLPEGPQRAAAWQQFVAKHPDQKSLDPAHLDPRSGPAMVAAEYGKYKDAQDVALKSANIAHMNASTALAQSQVGNAPIQRQLLEAQLANATKPQWTKIGQDAMGVEQYGFVDPRTQKVIPAAGAGAGVSGGIDLNKSSGLTGDEFLKTLPPEVAAEIKGYAEGRIPYSPTMARSPRGMAMTRLIEQYDPQFDAVNYASRQRTRNDFTAGKAAQNLSSFNTAIGHLDSLDKTIDPLGNTNYPLLNTARNAVRGQTSQEYQIAQKNFATAKNAVVEELTRAFKGTAGSLTEVHEWEKVLNGADSPAALKAAVKQAVDLLESRIEAVGDQYNRGMGTTRQALELLNPKARATLERLKDGALAARPQPSTQPARVSSPDEAAKLPSGTVFMTPDGRMLQVP